MEDTTNILYRGINLAKELEANMPNLVANDSDVLSSKCEEIIRLFSNVKERVAPNVPHQTRAINVHAAAQEQNNTIEAGSFQEWLLTNSTETSNIMELNDAPQHFLTGDLKAPTKGKLVNPIPVADSSRSRPLSSSQRQRRRKGETGKRTIRVAAPRISNTDVPPEDGFAWRKYGQKEILGAKFPRAYYRCTHQKMYDCPAKKQVQRLNEDPFTFEVTYQGDHQCYLTSTAPSISPSPEINQEMNNQEVHTPGRFHSLPMMPLRPVPSTIPLGHWIFMNVNNHSSEEGTSTRENFGIDSNDNSSVGPPLSSAAVRYGSGVVDYQNVADLADVMFNSGSSSNNSLAHIFGNGRK